MRIPIRRIGNLVFDIDWLLLFVSGGAASRALLYLLPSRTPPEVPFQGIYSILPETLTAFYGVIWAVVAVFGIWAAISLRALFVARIFIFSMFAVWTLLYAVGVFFTDDPGNATFWSSSLLFLSLACVSLFKVGKPKNRAIYVVLTPAYLRSLEQRRSSLTMNQLIKELHRYSTTPEDILSALSPDGGKDERV